MDASDYLSRVMQEAKGLPDIFVAATTNATCSKPPNEKLQKQSGAGAGGTSSSQSNYVPIDGSAASLSYLLSRRSSLTPPPSIQHLPKTGNTNIEEWTGSVVSSFERLRDYLERSKAQGFGGKKTNRIPLPTMKDRLSWHVFCVGDDEASGNPGAYFADDYDHDDAYKSNGGKGKQGKDETPVLLPPWRIGIPTNGHEPSARLLLQMDQVMIRRVLSHLTHYVHLGWCITAGTGRRGEWIYALLSRLEKPIHRDDAAVLFGLLKDLTLARSKIDFSRGEKDRSNLAKLNVLIVLVGAYFEQGGSLSKIMACE